MNAPPASESFLRLVSPVPGFFLVDTRLLVWVDGHPVLDASFLRGFDWWTPIAPVIHVVATRLQGVVTRERTYSIEVRPGLVTVVVLDYSRTWGNLTSRPKSVTFVPR
jgi:hypothetical protein